MNNIEKFDIEKFDIETDILKNNASVLENLDFFLIITSMVYIYFFVVTSTIFSTFPPLIVLHLLFQIMFATVNLIKYKLSNNSLAPLILSLFWIMTIFASFIKLVG